MEVEEMVEPIIQFEEHLHKLVKVLEGTIGVNLDYTFVMIQSEKPKPGKRAVFASLGNVKPVEKACELLRLAAEQMESRAPDVEKKIDDEGSVH